MKKTQLTHTKDVETKRNYRSLTLRVPMRDILLSKGKIQEIVNYFREHGYCVSKRAIEHNYHQWMVCVDSGYRGSNYHLLTTHNETYKEIMFQASSLSKFCADWQVTCP